MPADAPANELLSRLLRARVLRFGVIGVSNALLSFLIFSAVYRALPGIQVRAGIAQLASYALSTGWSYFWNRRWTFQSRQGVTGEATRFVASQAFFAAISAGLMHLAVDLAKLPRTPAWLVVMAGVTVLNFLAARFWVFAQRTPQA